MVAHIPFEAGIEANQEFVLGLVIDVPEVEVHARKEVYAGRNGLRHGLGLTHPKKQDEEHDPEGMMLG